MKQYIFQTNEGRVLIDAPTEAEAIQALRNLNRYSKARLVGVQVKANE